jgi:hypothetical protein
VRSLEERPAFPLEFGPGEDRSRKLVPGFGKEPVPKGYTIRWQVVPRFSDIFQAPQKPGDPGIEPAVTAIQGIPNTRHVLQLRREGDSGNTAQPVVLLRAIRVYRPPVPAAGS